MIYGRVPGIGEPPARVVQGTVMLNTAEEEKSFALLDEVFGHGGNAFDTAHQYGGGDCERVFGRWVRGRGIYEGGFVVGKGTPVQDRGPTVPQVALAYVHAEAAEVELTPEEVSWLETGDPPGSTRGEQASSA